MVAMLLAPRGVLTPAPGEFVATFWKAAGGGGGKEGAPLVKVAPSLTQELAFTRKPQLESGSWLPSSTIEAVELEVWLGG